MPVEKAHREAGRGIRATQVRSSSFVGAGDRLCGAIRRPCVGLSHEPACQVDEPDVVSAGCFVTGFCDDRLGIRVANLLQARDLALEGALLRGVVARLDWKMRNTQKE